MNISVVIPFHERDLGTDERPCRIARVLSNLNLTVPCPAEIICVDDNSPISWEPLIRQHRATYLRVPMPRHEPHVARRALARQLGLCAARHEVVLFLDADILVPAGLIGQLLAAVRKHGPKAMVFTPRHDVVEDTSGSGSPSRRKYTQRPQAYAANSVHGFRQPLWARQSSHCFAVARKFVQSAGGWDVNFLGWGEEDTELFYRLWRRGGKIVTLRNVFVRHLVHPVDHQANHDSFVRNARYFTEKHPDVARARRSFYRYCGILMKCDDPIR